MQLSFVIAGIKKQISYRIRRLFVLLKMNRERSERGKNREKNSVLGI